jgi:transposase
VAAKAPPVTRQQVRAAYEQGPDAVYELIVGLLTPLVERLERLEAERAKDSHNSGKPPSSDPVRVPKSLRTKSGKRPGAQPGHPGATLEMRNAPDVIVLHAAKHCAACGRSLALRHGEIVERRQVFELPPMQLMCTEHRLARCRCPDCGAWTLGRFPPGVHASVQYGSGVLALGVYLTTQQLLPAARAAHVLHALTGQRVSAATITAAEERAAEMLEPVSARIRQGLRRSAVLNLDETGFFISGRRQWLHTVSTPALTHYTSHEKRGRGAHEATGILPGYQGTIVHDSYDSYFTYPCRHALCGVHLLRELTFLIEENDERWARALKRSLLVMKRAVERAKAAGHVALDRVTLRRYHRRYDTLLALGEAAQPPPSPRIDGTGRPRRTLAANSLLRLREYREAVLRFLHDFAVPFDNREAERDLRMMKVEQKISGGFRTSAGAEIFCTIRGYLATARKQGRSALDVLRDLFAAQPFMPAVPE